jgi:type IV secretory pathway VirB4 component
MGRPLLRLSYHRGTTAHVASIHPFSVQAPLRGGGPYIGVDLAAGGAEFCWDPFDAYAAEVVTNPNCWVLGEPGFGKSALIKCLLWRMAALYGTGTGGRWMAIADPKGEYALLAEYLGLTVIRLTPGGATSVNPLAPGPAAGHEPPDVQVLRHAAMVAAMVATVLGRPLSQLEDAAVFAALEDLADQTRRREATLRDVAARLVTPSDTMLARLRRSGADLAGDLAQVVYALDNLLTRSLRGMFDGPTSVPLRWDGPGVVLDLSAVPLESAALPLVMVAAAGWLQQLMACPGPQRVQVLDEAWAFLKTRHTAGFLQSCFKLGRSYGTANICLSHRISDLAAQADDGTATAKIGKGLIADSATKIILRQAPDQIATTVEHAGLTEPQADAVARLGRGCALWKVGSHTTLVDHIVGPGEIELTDTDHRMRALGPPGLDPPQPPDANSGVTTIHILGAPEAGEWHRDPARAVRGFEMAQNRTGGGRRSPVVGTSPSDHGVDPSQCAAPGRACL